jgi:hypothetical protein
MPYLLAHLIGHGWRDYLLYGGAGVGMAGGFWLFVSGRAARLRRDEEQDAAEELSDPPVDDGSFAPRCDGE